MKNKLDLLTIVTDTAAHASGITEKVRCDAPEEAVQQILDLALEVDPIPLRALLGQMTEREDVFREGKAKLEENGRQVHAETIDLLELSFKMDLQLLRALFSLANAVRNSKARMLELADRITAAAPGESIEAKYRNLLSQVIRDFGPNTFLYVLGRQFQEETGGKVIKGGGENDTAEEIVEKIKAQSGTDEILTIGVVDPKTGARSKIEVVGGDILSAVKAAMEAGKRLGAVAVGNSGIASDDSQPPSQEKIEKVLEAMKAAAKKTEADDDGPFFKEQ